MSQQKQSSSGEASQKPTDQDEINKKRLALKERLRSDAAKKAGISNVADGIEERNKNKEIIPKTITKKEAIKNHAKDVPRLNKDKFNFESHMDITKRNHGYRIKRMGKVFGADRVEALRKGCVNNEEFKWELYQSEVREEVTIKEAREKEPDAHLYKPDAPGSQPTNFSWRGEDYQIDAKTDFDPAILEKIVKHLAGNGSIRSFCARLNIPTRKFKRWTKYQCVRDAIDYGEGMTLDTYEKVAHALACGMDVKKLSENFIKKPERSILQNLMKHRHKSSYYEKEEITDDDKKDVAMLDGEALKKKVAELRTRRDRMDGDNRFAKSNPYRSDK